MFHPQILQLLKLWNNDFSKEETRQSNGSWLQLNVLHAGGCWEHHCEVNNIRKAELMLAVLRLDDLTAGERKVQKACN